MSSLVPYSNNGLNVTPLCEQHHAQQRFIDLMEVANQSLNLNATLLQGSQDWELDKSKDDLELESLDGLDLDLGIDELCL